MLSVSFVPSTIAPAAIRVSSGKHYACLKLEAGDGSQDFTLHVGSEVTALAIAALLATDDRFVRDADGDNLFTPDQEG